MVIGHCRIDQTLSEKKQRRRKILVWKAPDLSLLDVDSGVGAHVNDPTSRQIRLPPPPLPSSHRCLHSPLPSSVVTLGALNSCSSSCCCSCCGCCSGHTRHEDDFAVVSSLQGSGVLAQPKTPGSGAIVGTRRFSRCADTDRDGIACSVERWLDEHPSFTQDYFVRKASQKMIDTWILFRLSEDNVNNRRNCMCNHNAKLIRQQTLSVPNTRKASWAGTPVRKLSSGEYIGDHERQLRQSLQAIITKKLMDEVTGRSIRSKLADPALDSVSGGQTDDDKGQGHQSPRLHSAGVIELSSQQRQQSNHNICNKQRRFGSQDAHKHLNERHNLYSSAEKLKTDPAGGIVDDHDEPKTGQMEDDMEDVSAVKNNQPNNVNTESTTSYITSDQPASVPSDGYHLHRYQAPVVRKVLSLACRTYGASQAAIVLFESPIDSATHQNQSNQLRAQVVGFTSCNLSNTTCIEGDSLENVLSLLQQQVSGSPVKITALHQTDLPIPSAVDAEKIRYPCSVLCQPIRNNQEKTIAFVQLLTSPGLLESDNSDLGLFSEHVMCLSAVLNQPCTDVSGNPLRDSNSDLKQVFDLLEALPSTHSETRLLASSGASNDEVSSRDYDDLALLLLEKLTKTLNCSQSQLFIVDKNNPDQFNTKLEICLEQTNANEETDRTGLKISSIDGALVGNVYSRSATNNKEFSPMAVSELMEGGKSSSSPVLQQTVRSSDGHLLAVIQLKKQNDTKSFNKLESTLVTYISGYLALFLVEKHTKMDIESANLRCEVMKEMVSRHTVCSEEQSALLLSHIESTDAIIGLDEFHFDDVTLNDQETLKMCWQMFSTRDCLRRFRIESSRFCRWLITVKQNYRPITYHNWRHALVVCQTMYALLLRSGWWDKFGHVDCFSLLLACLCHDLDHRGTNNSFQHRVNSPLARLYGTSVMENHHFQCCLDILNTTGVEILSKMSRSEYNRAIEVIEKTILATDLHLHLKRRSEMFGMIEKSSFDWSSSQNCDALQSCLVTTADICAVAKPWPMQYRIAKLVAEEFYQQGDLEKELLNIVPLDLMNRDKSDYLPNEQLEFIDNICLPVIKAISGLSPAFKPLLEAIEENREHWSSMCRT